jgi:hypothetical protein
MTNDPELERLLDEELEIERRVHAEKQLSMIEELWADECNADLLAEYVDVTTYLMGRFDGNTSEARRWCIETTVLSLARMQRGIVGP